MLENILEKRIYIPQTRSIDFGNLEANALGDSICDVEQIDRVETKVVPEIDVRRQLVACEIGGDIENQLVESLAQGFGVLRLLHSHHSFSGSASWRAMAVRKREPSWPSLAR